MPLLKKKLTAYNKLENGQSVMEVLLCNGGWDSAINEMNFNRVTGHQIGAPAHEGGVGTCDITETEGKIPVGACSFDVRIDVMQVPLGASNFLTAKMIKPLS